MRASTAIGIAAGGGLLFGAADSVVNNLSSPYTSAGAAVDGTIFGDVLDVASMILDAGWAWAAVAVLAGIAAARNWQTGAAAGAICLVAATVAYYLTESAFQQAPISVGEMLVLPPGFGGAAPLPGAPAARIIVFGAAAVATVIILAQRVRRTSPAT